MTGGYLEQQRRLSPVSLAAVIAAHAAVIGLMVMSVTHTLPRTIEFDPIRNWEVPPPPPPPPPTHETHERSAKPASHIDEVKSTVDTRTPDETHITLPPLTPTPADSGPVTGPSTGPVIEQTKLPPQPVLADAAVDPRYAGDFQPDYPPSLERSGVEGTAVVRVRIGTDGRVKEVQQVSADDPAFFAATEKQALRRWRFKPATRDGAAVETWKTMTVRFRLQEG